MSESSPETEVEAYTSSASVEQGGTVGFHVRVQAKNNCQMTIKKSTTGEQVFEQEFVVDKFVKNSLDIDAAAHGCDWPVAFALTVPQSWPSDIYLAELRVNKGRSVVPLVVRAKTPGSSILLKVTDTTAQAYNNWGGQSLYNRDPMAKSVQITFDRPYVRIGYKYDYWWFDLRFLDWCHRRNIKLDCCSSVDIHSGSVDLNSYNLMVSIGHDEYWSKETRNRVETFVQEGGHVCFFGANTCFWQVRFERNCRQMIGYKELAAKDPMVLQDPSRVTGRWSMAPTNRPENEMTLVSYRNGGGWWDVIPDTDHDRRYGKVYCVSRPEHWVFDGTDLTQNDTFGTYINERGERDTIMGHETDGAVYTFSDAGVPVVSGEDGTPLDAIILAYCDLTDWPGETKNGQSGTATMAIRELPNGGAVFSAGTVNWGGALTDYGSTVVDRVTENLLLRLKQSNQQLAVSNQLQKLDNEDSRAVKDAGSTM